MGTHLSIDEVALSQGELYTIVTNKKFKGKQGCLVAIVAGTKAEQVIEHISKIDYKKRSCVQEITDQEQNLGRNCQKKVRNLSI